MPYIVRITDTLNPEGEPTRLPVSFPTEWEAAKAADDQDERQINPGRFVYEVVEEPDEEA